MKRARFTPAAVVELEDAARRVDRARPGWGEPLGPTGITTPTLAKRVVTAPIAP